MSTLQGAGRAILEALAYSDIFNYTLRFDELTRYLPVPVNGTDLRTTLAQLDGRVGHRDGYYFLTGRQEIVSLRQRREPVSRRVLGHAIRYGRVLSILPFIRMVAITGSLAVLNCDQTADLDYMLVAAPGRVWTARAFALGFNRLTRLWGHTLCPNLIVSENALEWPLHDLYSARELCQMLVVSGHEVHARLIAANPWAHAILPNANGVTAPVHAGYQGSGLSRRIQMVMESPLRGSLGDRFERWEMVRKIARFTKLPGFGVETVFSADVCQGNFHHHRSWAREYFEQRLATLDLESLPARGNPS
jgi:hypothetical protein